MKLKFGILATILSLFYAPSSNAQLSELPCICELMASLEIAPETPKQKIIIEKKTEEERISWTYEELYSLRNPESDKPDQTDEQSPEVSESAPRRPVSLEKRNRSKIKKIRISFLK